MPVAAIAAVGVGGIVAGAMGAKQGANAAQGIAFAQQGVANQMEAGAQTAAAKMSAMAAPTAQELQQITTNIQNQQRYQAVQDASVSRDTQILNSLSPALVTAGQQANQLMQGQQAAVLKPMQQQQQVQRQQLQAQLAAQLGPGYATSSAGQQALQQFDMNTNTQTAQAQQSALSNVSNFLGFQSQSVSNLQGSMRMGAETIGNMGAQTQRALGDIQSRQVGAIGQGQKFIEEGQEAQMHTAGAEFAGEAASAKSLNGLGGGLMGMAGSMAGGLMGRK